MALQGSSRLAHHLLGKTVGGAFATSAAKTTVDWKKVSVPATTAKDIPETIGGIAPKGDLRATSGLGLGDGIKNHTDKWLQASGGKSPMQYINEVPPVKVKGLVVASHGTDDPALGCPVEYISLKGTSLEKPAVCKYTGNRYYSDDWKHGAHHH
ncbi:NADH dehydrogenase [ubiquinone] iron-sulfur protein 6, mitochondrial [Tetrabaena socialis]|uniref:NADH dehydrogenase [ubiquinone] iron-sulfur protein 6, mitochondrial n=1 Tax=Tetrabaena socialis TaxID=47790 RepID=A0A2J7ZZZ2_9CHLO|nr:NADH dehydrogenase [ubiquinone] iron-sulfur protein 6, mitochondrial [Tetrabaena socialis]|eukprot:PNH05808.1 NADH dehydrogenase [ubiquinone] iron-sulfur protein 6, mitochondrial [Tetrabaena socialis]